MRGGVGMGAREMGSIPYPLPRALGVVRYPPYPYLRVLALEVVAPTRSPSCRGPRRRHLARLSAQLCEHLV